uniref:hypothetical protein n=1 Tax=Symbiochloris sp. SG-2018 TaxID=2126034 RepID=UPI0021144BBF|nr:hypothetical protein NRL16_pgp031 [Symbiochloris sp. SG-2018]UTQ75739.1 hypothetical protein [Symbiochloris sp. SG-2018]
MKHMSLQNQIDIHEKRIIESSWLVVTWTLIDPNVIKLLLIIDLNTGEIIDVYIFSHNTQFYELEFLSEEGSFIERPYKLILDSYSSNRPYTNFWGYYGYDNRNPQFLNFELLYSTRDRYRAKVNPDKYPIFCYYRLPEYFYQDTKENNQILKQICTRNWRKDFIPFVKGTEFQPVFFKKMETHVSSFLKREFKTQLGLSTLQEQLKLGEFYDRDDPDYILMLDPKRVRYVLIKSIENYNNTAITQRSSFFPNLNQLSVTNLTNEQIQDYKIHQAFYSHYFYRPLTNEEKQDLSNSTSCSFDIMDHNNIIKDLNCSEGCFGVSVAVCPTAEKYQEEPQSKELLTETPQLEKLENKVQKDVPKSKVFKASTRSQDAPSESKESNIITRDRDKSFEVQQFCENPDVSAVSLPESKEFPLSSKITPIKVDNDDTIITDSTSKMTDQNSDVNSRLLEIKNQISTIDDYFLEIHNRNSKIDDYLLKVYNRSSKIDDHLLEIDNQILKITEKIPEMNELKEVFQRLLKHFENLETRIQLIIEDKIQQIIDEKIQQIIDEKIQQIIEDKVISKKDIKIEMDSIKLKEKSDLFQPTNALQVSPQNFEKELNELNILVQKQKNQIHNLMKQLNSYKKSENLKEFKSHDSKFVFQSFETHRNLCFLDFRELYTAFQIVDQNGVSSNYIKARMKVSLFLLYISDMTLEDLLKVTAHHLRQLFEQNSIILPISSSSKEKGNSQIEFTDSIKIIIQQLEKDIKILLNGKKETDFIITPKGKTSPLKKSHFSKTVTNVFNLTSPFLTKKIK